VDIMPSYYSPRHAISCPGHYYKDDSLDRAPNPGMLSRAQSDLNLGMLSSFIISDIQAALAASSAKSDAKRIRTRFFSLKPASYRTRPQNRWGAYGYSGTETSTKLTSSAGRGTAMLQFASGARPTEPSTLQTSSGATGIPPTRTLKA
jgi:hypothetical protein